MRNLFVTMSCVLFAACPPLQPHTVPSDVEEELGATGEEPGDDEEPVDEEEPGDEEEPEEPAPVGPDLGDVGFNVSWDLLHGYSDRFTMSVSYEVEICFDRDEGQGVSAANVGDEPIDVSFGVVLGLYRVDDGELWLAEDALWSDLVLQPGESVVWGGPFCTTLSWVTGLMDPNEYSVLVLVDAWDDIVEPDEENNVALSSTIELVPTDGSNM